MAAQQLPLGIQHQQGGISVHVILFPQLHAFPLLHVYFHAYKAGIEIFAHLLLHELLGSHPFARTAPARVAIHEHQLVLRLGGLQRFGETAFAKVNLCRKRQYHNNNSK